MSVTVTTRISPITSWVSSPSNRLPMPSSTTPHGLPIRTPASVGQPLSPTLTNKSKSSQPPFASPGYFTLAGDQTSGSGEMKSKSQGKSHVTPVVTPRQPTQAHRPAHQDLQSKYEAFRRQSESNSFNLSHGSLPQFSTAADSRRSSSSKSPDSAKSRRDQSSSPRPRKKPSREKDRETQALEMMDMDSSFHGMDAQFSKDTQEQLVQDIPRTQSPANNSSYDLSRLGRTRPSLFDERDPRRSLPENRIDAHPSSISAGNRADTLPISFSTDGPTLMSAQDINELINNNLPPDLLILDVRVFAQFSQSRVSGALNLNLPTTLLKRPTYDVQRLSSTFNKSEEKSKFDQWRDAKFIIVYDANSSQLRDATTCVNTLKKFTKEGWEGSTLVIKGGFASVLKHCPDLITKGSGDEGQSTRKLSIDPSKPVAGGCLIPSQSTAAMPFFSAIRQNQDLRDGVGQIPINLPQALNEKGTSELPKWLKKATDERDKGKTVAASFLRIEQAEQKRMQQAYSTTVAFESPHAKNPSNIQIAGIEKGTKNRYKDMLPYDHTRVRLQDKPLGDCDYVNASHVKTERSNRRYIASQAPVPATFEDFWSVTWQQDTRVIIMLTAESEGGQTKCHPYWLPGNYGPFKIQAVGERHVSLETDSTSSSIGPSFSSSSRSEATPSARMSLASPGTVCQGRRRSTTFSNATSGQPDPAPPFINVDTPHIIIRKLMLSHDAQPYAPIREITQLQYTSWPDFGTPAHPLHVLRLVEQCGEVIRSYDGSTGLNSPAPEGERPVVVHCSAGCGRTGTFCTVDSVIDVLKRQQQAKVEKAKTDKMDVDVLQGEVAEATSDEDDLIVKVVEDFRLQRQSMVQTLRQFVLCYEAVLEWIAAKTLESNVKKQLGQDRRSYQG